MRGRPKSSLNGSMIHSSPPTLKNKKGHEKSPTCLDVHIEDLDDQTTSLDMHSAYLDDQISGPNEHTACLHDQTSSPNEKIVGLDGHTTDLDNHYAIAT